MISVQALDAARNSALSDIDTKAQAKTGVETNAGIASFLHTAELLRPRARLLDRRLPGLLERVTLDG